MCTICFDLLNFFILPTKCICVLYDSQNKWRLFPRTAVNGLSLSEDVKRGMNLNFIYYATYRPTDR
jgi:hypothetical protein